MKYISFENEGRIDLMSMMLMGASSKINNPNKIGEYGTGWKYAIAVLLRHDVPIRVYSGEAEIDIDTRAVKLWDDWFDMVTINGIDTYNTTELGKDWQLWMALREIYCNAIDEGAYSINHYRTQEEISRQARKTKVIIGITTEIEEIINNWMYYFAFDRTDDVMDIPGVKIYKRLNPSKSIIYRKGIKVAESTKRGCYDYDFDNIPINEIREAKDFADISNRLKMCMKNNANAEVLKTILESDGTWERDINFYNWDTLNNKETWNTVIGNRAVVPAEYSKKLLRDDIKESTIIRLPATMAELISLEVKEAFVLGYERGNEFSVPVDYLDANMTTKLELAVGAVESMRVYKRPVVEVVNFNKDYIRASHDSEKIYLAEHILKGNAFMLLKTILAETIMLEKGFKANSDEMVGHLLEMYISYCLGYDANDLATVTEEIDNGADNVLF